MIQIQLDAAIQTLIDAVIFDHTTNLSGYTAIEEAKANLIEIIKKDSQSTNICTDCGGDVQAMTVHEHSLRHQEMGI